MTSLTLFAMLLVPPMTEGAGSPPSFADDVGFLKKHTDAFLLRDGKAAVAVVPQYQGRVMTSTSDAAKGEGNGWINYAAVQSGEIVPHINVFGGEDRFWLGPEGGQFSIFFKGGDPFDLEHWQTPAPIDSERYAILQKTDRSATMARQFKVANYMGAEFLVGVRRQVSMVDGATAAKHMGVSGLKGVESVAYATKNTVTNKGGNAWTADSGALSVWILGMYKPGDRTTIVIPFDKKGIGAIVNDAYFGKVPADRLKVGDGVVFFKGDGKRRTKIGISPRRVKRRGLEAAMGSFDADRNLLTVVLYTYPKGDGRYVNSMWEIQENPFGGDVANSYNDGPASPGAKPLGPFYELESSSPALFLGPGQSATHVHATYHFKGPRAELDKIARKVLGVGLDRVSRAL